ncbi:MAG: hypothetical protein KDB14_16270 [Planctomycetales bacterium]|nr:hypothetical protein [Planctomycetales bacterium]
MLDQAAELRKLAVRAAQARGAAPVCVAVAGAAEGVGCTAAALTIARRLATGATTLVVDVNDNARAADMLQTAAATTDATTAGTTAATASRGSEGLEDVLSARRTLDQVIRPVGDRLYVTAGRRATWECGAVERLRRQLRAAPFDYVVLDLGARPQRELRSLCGGDAGGALLVVASGEGEQLLNAYSTIKTMAAAETPGSSFPATAQARGTGDSNDATTPPLAVSVLIKQVDASLAEQLHERLAKACRQFLDRRVELLHAGEQADWVDVLTTWVDHLAAQRASQSARSGSLPDAANASREAVPETQRNLCNRDSEMD